MGRQSQETTTMGNTETVNNKTVNNDNEKMTMGETNANNNK